MKNLDIWVNKIANATNRRMLEQWDLHNPQTIKATSTQDLDHSPLVVFDHPSVLPHELFALEPGDPPSRTLTWKPLGFLSFQIDLFGDHLQTCQAKSAATQVHDWVVYRLGDILGSVGHRVKKHKITAAQGKERGDVEIRDYVVLQKPRDGTDCLPPPRTLILDFTMTHTRFGRSHLSSLGQLTHSRSSDGAPEPDGALREAARTKIRRF
jgi:hypothetical protein